MDQHFTGENMYRILKAITTNPYIKEYAPDEYMRLVKAVEYYFSNDAENVISVCAPVCEYILRVVCTREGLKCRRSNMFDMIEDIRESKIPHSSIEMSYLHVLRIMMNKKRHAAEDQHKILIFDAYTAIYATFLLLEWYIGLYHRDFVSYLDKKESLTDDWFKRKRELTKIVNKNEYSMALQILERLLESPVGIDALIREVNASRMVLLKTVTVLLDREFIVWKEDADDVIMINERIYNNRYLIERVIDETNEKRS